MIYGNGAWAAHRKAHKSRKDGHHAVTRDQFAQLTINNVPTP